MPRQKKGFSEIERNVRKEIADSLIVTTDGKDTLMPLANLKHSPIHISVGNKIVSEIRYQGEKARKLPNRDFGSFDVSFKSYFKKDGMQIVGFQHDDGTTYIKVKGGAHDVIASFAKDDVYQRHKLAFSVMKLLGYKAYRKGKGWCFVMPKNR